MDATARNVFDFRHSRNILISIISFSVLFISTAIVLTTVQNLRSVRAITDRSLENLSASLSLSVENFLRGKISPAYDELSRLFPDRIIAYALIADRQGQIIYHTNRSLIGSAVANTEQRESVFLSGRPEGFRATLGTGVPVYRFFYLLRLSDKHEQLLELVLNSSSSDQVLAEARRIWWVVGAILILLWSIGFLLVWALKRYAHLQEQLEERRRLALIGQMTATLTHEIRNAVGGIKGFTQWVDEKTDSGDPRKSGLSMILKGTDRVEGLVNDLLLYSKEETYHFSEFDLGSLIQDVVDEIRLNWSGSENIETRPGVMVTADRDKLHRALMNGVRNAIDSMGDEGELTITTANNRHSVTISIQDTGKGISDADVPRLFTPFFTTRTEGTGLGLAYSQKVVQGMGGKISLHNRTNGPGAVLTIDLPWRRTNA